MVFKLVLTGVFEYIFLAWKQKTKILLYFLYSILYYFLMFLK